MQYMGNFSGSSPVIKRYKASATGYVVGILMLRSAGNASGQMSTSTTTSTADALGLLIDTGDKGGESVTYSTTQGADEAVFGVIVNPDAILRAQMVSGATGTATATGTVTSASSNGLTVVGDNVGSPVDYDEGILWYLTGTNVGRSRKITSTSTVTATVIVPFAANAVGDTYSYAGLNIGLQGVTLTTDLKNARTDIAVSTGATLSTLSMELNGTTNSFVHLVVGDSVFNNAT